MIIQAAVKREVKEESGFDFEPEALLCVECHAHSWVRFTLGGRIVGGALKTVAEGDRESLQAQWQPADKTELLQSVSDVCVCVCVCEIVGGNDSIYVGNIHIIRKFIIASPHVNSLHCMHRLYT